MEFPIFVPAPIQAHIEAILEGEPERGIPGYIRLLDEAKQKLDAVTESLNRKSICGEVEYLDGLRLQKLEAMAHHDRLTGDVDCMQRLAKDLRMRDGYAMLSSVVEDDEQQRGFIHAAWAARIDYSKYRDRLKQASELKGLIAEAAEELAELLHRFADTGAIGPDEFFSISELLRQTDNHGMQNHNLYMWRSMRRHILGDLPEQIPANPQPLDKVGIQIQFFSDTAGNNAEISPEEKTANMLRYAWGTAPEVSALLRTLADAARTFRPRELGMIGAAIDSRQHNPKTEYLRAFANLLTKVHNINLTTKVMHVMATVATVVINLPDVDVTFDDVRKVLAKAGS